MVVVGTIDHVTTHEVVINYNEGNSQVTVKREDFGASGPAGVEHPDLDTLNRAFGIKQCICFSCENNNEGNQVRRQRVATVDSEGNEKAQIITCNMCDGKGTVIEWARGFSPAIDTHWMDIVEVLEQGYAPDHSIPTFASMMKGGRDSITNQWDVQITPVAMGAMKDGVFHVDGRYAMRKNGDGVEVKTFIADLIQHYNQQYATPDMPLGMKIGRPKTGQYATTQHRDVIPMFKAWCDSRGLKSNAYGMNHGQEAYLDIEVSSKGTRQEILQSMRTEGRTIDEETLRPVALSKDPRGVVSFGIQIKSSFDGAIQFCAIAERVVCLNGMVGTRTEVLLALTHKHASMALLEIDGLEHKVMTAALAMYEQASQIEAMNYIMLEVADFERALVIAAERGLLTMPGLGLNGNLTGGRTLRTAIEGWHNPSADFVLVGEDYNGIPNSLYHLNNIFNGAITHQPPTNDAHGLVTGLNRCYVASSN